MFELLLLLLSEVLLLIMFCVLTKLLSNNVFVMCNEGECNGEFVLLFNPSPLSEDCGGGSMLSAGGFVLCDLVVTVFVSCVSSEFMLMNVCVFVCVYMCICASEEIYCAI